MRGFWVFKNIILISGGTYEVRIGGFKYAEDVSQHSAEEAAEAKRLDRIQLARVLYSLLKGQDFTVVEEGSELVTDFDFREAPRNPYNYRQVMSRHLIEFLVKFPEFSYKEVATHVLFQEVIKIIAIEDRVRSYSTTHRTTDADFNTNQPVFDSGRRWTESIKDKIVVLELRAFKPRHTIDENTFVGMAIERRNWRHHPPLKKTIQDIVGAMWTQSFEYWEKAFPRFSMWLFQRAPLIGREALCTQAEFKEYFPSSYRFYEACASIDIRKK